MQPQSLFSRITAIALLAASASISHADTLPDTWVGTDELGRTLPTADNRDGSPAAPDSRVEIGMFYYIWHGTEACMKPVNDNTELLKASTDNPQWGAERTYHWGSRPWLGYYDAGDRDVIYKHLQMLCDAGIDFIVFDCTNGLTYINHIQTVIDIIRTRQSNGMRWPKLACMTHSRQTMAITDLWNRLYSKPEYADLWYRWQNAPLLLCDAAEARADKALAHIIPHFTLRHSWAWTGGREDTWSWLDYYPQGIGYTMSDGRKIPECISVGSAQHPTTNVGKSYSNGQQPPTDAHGLCPDTPRGLYFAEQWQRAHSLPDGQRPPVVLLTQWNEHIAMRFITGDKTGADPGKVRPGGKTGDPGECYFVDVYNAEYNRDLEPSTHPLLRDNYYMQMAEEIRRYRGTADIPTPSRPLTINIDGSWEQWDKEPLTFTDDPADNRQLSVAQAPAGKQQGNDIIRCKVANDSTHLYFLVETSEPITWGDGTTPRHMRLLLNTDCDHSTGWNGYDYIVSREPATGNYELKQNTSAGEFKWTAVPAQIPTRHEGTRLMIAVPKNAIGRQGNFDFDFKWSDNCNFEANGEAMLMYSDGDCAPNHRFNYRFKGSAL